jgi:hypothetical protein
MPRMHCTLRVNPMEQVSFRLGRPSTAMAFPRSLPRPEGWNSPMCHDRNASTNGLRPRLDAHIKKWGGATRVHLLPLGVGGGRPQTHELGLAAFLMLRPRIATIFLSVQ